MAITAPTIVTRQQWGAKPFNGTPIEQPRYRKITLHHAAGFGADNLRRGKSQLRAIQELHQDARGWSDIGYHFVLDSGGRIYQGRPFVPERALEDRPGLVIGAHVANANTGNIGVCLLGCFHPPANPGTCTDVLTEARQDSLVALLVFLCSAYEIDPSNILAHSDQSPTDCPGDNLRRRIHEIRLLVKQRVEGIPEMPLEVDGPAVDLPPDDEGLDRWSRALTALGGSDVVGASALTARQDGLGPGVAASHKMAETDLPRAQALKSLFVMTGMVFDVPPALLAAVASRESRCGKGLAADGTGDNGNGFGIMQIDRRHHTPVGGPRSREHLEQAARILADFRRDVERKHPDWEDKHLLKGAVVAYNSGVSNVQTIARMDKGSTGNDYGSDTLARAQFYLSRGFA